MSPRLFLPLASAGLIALGASTSRAEPAPQPSWTQPPPPAYGLYPGWRIEEEGVTGEPKRSWYGAKTLLGLIPSDVVFSLGYVLTFSGGRDKENTGLVMVFAGAAGHCLTGPIVHWAHGNVGRGFLSLGLNAGLPVFGAVIADGIDAGGLTIPLVVLSVIGWPIVDIAVLSYEDPPERKRKTTFVMPSFSILPMVDHDNRGLSLVGQF